MLFELKWQSGSQVPKPKTSCATQQTIKYLLPFTVNFEHRSLDCQLGMGESCGPVTVRTMSWCDRPQDVTTQ